MNLQDEHIKVASCNLYDLFNNRLNQYGITGALAIPEYQRPYIWGKVEVSKLLNDLIEHFQESIDNLTDYYLGSIILHRHGGKLNVIDGQQRITTLGIVFNLLGQQVDIPFISPVSIQNIHLNSGIIKQRTNELQEVKQMILQHINITIVCTDKEDDAYQFFETQNTGGVRLRGVDIIKAFHLRAIEPETTRGRYAMMWEQQKAVDEVVKLLLKGRRWNLFTWLDVPFRMDETGLKRTIIEEFSEETKHSQTDTAFQLTRTIIENNGLNVLIPDYHYHIRQPLSSGENFVHYLRSFCSLYETLFSHDNVKQLNPEVHEFYKAIIFTEDGTTFLKWLFQLCMVSYVHRFGTHKLLEASYYIYRFSYSLRVSNEKAVREDSIPKFVKDKGVLECILQSFTHDQCMDLMKRFEYPVNLENTSGNSVKSRYIKRVSDYFEFDNTAENFDQLLLGAMDKKIENAAV